jgi:ankyrin repeat protein
MAPPNWMSPLAISLLLVFNTSVARAQAASTEKLSFRDPAAADLKAAIADANLNLVQMVVASALTNDCLELDEEGRTALHYAVRRCTQSEDAKSFEILKLLARRSGCVNVADRLGRKPILEIEPLTWSNRARIDALQILIANDADVNAQDENGVTILHQLLSSWDASALHWPEAIEILAKAGLKPNLTNSAGQTPLHGFFGPHGFCVSREGVRATKVAAAQKTFALLVNLGAKLTIRDSEGTTPVGELLNEYEIFFGTKETMLAFAGPFLAKQLNINAAVIKNRPALTFLCDKTQTDPDLIERLLELGADPKTAEQDGFTPLHGAAWFYNERVCQLLLEHGANVNALDDQGRTPLHEFARSNFNVSPFFDSDKFANIMKTVDTLLAHGADRKLKDKNGKRAVDLLKLPGDPTAEDEDILRALKKKLKP